MLSVPSQFLPRIQSIKEYEIIFFFALIFSNSSFGKNVYDTEFYHIEIITNNTSETKINEINRVVEICYSANM